MRIAIHTYSFNPNVGGIERVGNNLSRNLKYAGYEVFGISKNETASSNSSWTEHYTDTICANSQDIENGGGCPKTQYQMSEILQSVSLLDDSGLANGCNSRLSGQNTSKSSRGAFNLKVESSRNGVLGQAGGG